MVRTLGRPIGGIDFILSLLVNVWLCVYLSLWASMGASRVCVNVSFSVCVFFSVSSVFVCVGISSCVRLCVCIYSCAVLCVCVWLGALWESATVCNQTWMWSSITHWMTFTVCCYSQAAPEYCTEYCILPHKSAGSFLLSPQTSSMILFVVATRYDCWSAPLSFVQRGITWFLFGPITLQSKSICKSFVTLSLLPPTCTTSKIMSKTFGWFALQCYWSEDESHDPSRVMCRSSRSSLTARGRPGTTCPCPTTNWRYCGRCLSASRTSVLCWGRWGSNTWWTLSAGNYSLLIIPSPLPSLPARCSDLLATANNYGAMAFQKVFQLKTRHQLDDNGGSWLKKVENHWSTPSLYSITLYFYSPHLPSLLPPGVTPFS